MSTEQTKLHKEGSVDSAKDFPMPEPRHELDKIREYEAKGYTSSYQIEKGVLKDLNTGKTYLAQAVKIVAKFRYEGMSNPSDMSIMYIVKMADGSKGIILRPYGAMAVTPIDEFIQSVIMRDGEHPVD